MASNDPFKASLSDEENEALVAPPEESKKSPIKVTPRGEGYKFNVDQNLKDGFNFASASQTKLGSGTDAAENSSSSEDFEHINAPDDSAGGTEPNSVPNTPTKATPHKRTAHLTSAESLTANGSGGSPPRSPAPKKRKHWNDFIQEDDDKKKKAQEEQEKARQKKAEAQRPTWLRPLIMALVFGAAAIALYPYTLDSEHNNSSNRTMSPYSWKNASSNFIQWTRDLKTQFPKQSKNTWLTLGSLIRETLKKTEPSHPTAITVLYPPTVSQDFALCFLSKVGGLVNKAVAPLLGSDFDAPAPVKVIQQSAFTSTTSITTFRSDIVEYLTRSGKVTITVDIDKSKSEDFLMQFHGFCDSFHAVDKRATFLFPVHVSPQVFSQFEWSISNEGHISNEILMNAWKTTLSEDTIPALIARVAGAVILLNEGDTCTM